MEDQAPKQHKPQEPFRKIDHNSDWSGIDYGKDNQARSNPIDIQDPQPSTSYARDSTPLRWPNTYPKVLNLGRGRGKGIFPLGNWTSVVKGHEHGIINENDQSQTMQQESERHLAVVEPTDRIVHTDRIQTYDEEPALARPRPPLANWSSVNLGNNPNRPTVDEITKHGPQWHIFCDDNIENRPGQRHNDYHNRTSDDAESVEGDSIYSGDDSSRPGLEDVHWTKTNSKSMNLWVVLINYHIYRCV